MEDDIQNAIFLASPLKGLRYDRVPTLVWQKSGPTLKVSSATVSKYVTPKKALKRLENNQNFTIKKVQQEKLGITWKISPNFFLPTLSKAMEYLIA